MTLEIETSTELYLLLRGALNNKTLHNEAMDGMKLANTLVESIPINPSNAARLKELDEVRAKAATELKEKGVAINSTLTKLETLVENLNEKDRKNWEEMKGNYEKDRIRELKRLNEVIEETLCMVGKDASN
jgi:hypothetical protein